MTVTNQHNGWRAHAPETLIHLADLVGRRLAEDADLPPDTCELLGYSIARAFCDNFGGTQVYIPKADSLAQNERCTALWRDFDGRNVEQLARKYRISTVHVYRIVKRCRDAENARRQIELALE